MNSADNLHTDILDWSLHHAFDELSIAQQQTVLRSIAKEEYDELHNASMQLKKANTVPFAEDNVAGKEALMHRFEEVWKDKRRVALRPQIYWQAAAFILLFTCLGLSTALYRSKQVTALDLRKTRDTIVLVKNISAPQKIVRDTVYCSTEPQKRSPNLRPAKQQNIIAEAGETIPEHANPAGDIHVVRLQAMTEKINTVKGVSVAEDSLAMAYKFVSL